MTWRNLTWDTIWTVIADVEADIARLTRAEIAALPSGGDPGDPRFLWAVRQDLAHARRDLHDLKLRIERLSLEEDPWKVLLAMERAGQLRMEFC